MGGVTDGPEASADEALAALRPEPGLVVLLCGMAGSGKTTLSQRLERRGFTRLSIDEEVWQRFGRHGVDFAEAEYRRVLDAAHAALQDRLRALVALPSPVVVDSALWNRASRDRYRALIEAAGGRSQLVYLKAALDVLRARLAVRNRRCDANAPFPITEEVLVRYAAAFEEPVGEEPIIVVR